MKRTIKYKRIISLIAVLIIAISLFSVQVDAAYSVTGQRIKAGIAAAITALNITLNSTVAPIQEMIDYIGDPFDVDYTWAEAWNDRPQIQIWNDYIEIDGEQYTDIWISNEAAEKFRVNAFDFISAKNIASNDSGEFASGAGYFNGVPVYDTGETPFPLKSQRYEMYTDGSYIFGDSTVTISPEEYGRQRGTVYYNGTNVNSLYDYSNRFPWWSQVRGVGNSVSIALGNSVSSQNGSSFPFVSVPFDFDWVSQTIPLNEPLPDDTGMMIRIPSYDPNGNRYLEPFYVDNPEFDDNQPVTVDVNVDPDIMTKLDDLFDIIAPIIPIINNNFGDVSFVENHESPAPVIDNLLPDTYKQEILNPIHNDFQLTQNTINQMGDTIVENIPKIDEICNNIDTAPYHDLDTGLDHLPTVFLPFITDLRSALGIWHYVTEWIGQIGTTFAFVTGCLVGTSIMTPIYAAIAGFMCIKVYRRMTG